MKRESKKIKPNLERMGYLELVRLEDEILSKYESLSNRIYRPNATRSRYVYRDYEQVKWGAGRICLLLGTLVTWGGLVYLVFERYRDVLPKILTQSIFGIFLYIGLLFFAVFFAHFFWFSLLNSFLRTVFRGLVHYWPATVLGISLLTKSLQA